MDPDALTLASVLASERRRQAELAERIRNGESLPDHILEAKQR